MSSSHKISLHLSRNNSLDSPRETSDPRPQDCPNPSLSTLKTQESLKKIKEILVKTTEKYKSPKVDKDLAYYKKLVSTLEQEK